jgi:aminoglycoside 2'-N-acetyltransferase I
VTGAGSNLRRIPTADLTPSEIAALRDLLWTAFPPGEEGFTEDDWEHALGGTHVVLQIDGRIVSHASVVERELHVADRPLRTGYVEAVATDPALQGRGHGTIVMRDATGYVRDGFELGGLGTGAHHFYERLGWLTWRADGGRRWVHPGASHAHIARARHQCADQLRMATGRRMVIKDR